jgi:acyl transferase domain-containing protein
MVAHRGEALATDPQTRILLEETHMALQQTATGSPAAFGSETGMYVGCMFQEYGDVLARSGGKLSSATATGNSLAFMVGRWVRGSAPCYCTVVSPLFGEGQVLHLTCG